MTKQEAINRAWALLEVLEALPDSSDILTAEARKYDSTITPPLYIHLSSGIEAVGTKLGIPVLSRTPENSEYIHRKIRAKHGEYICGYCQLEEDPKKKTAPGVDGTRDGGTAEQGPTEDTTIITTGKEEVKP